MVRTPADVEMIAVDADGELIMWHENRVWADNAELKGEVEFAARVHEQVQLVWGVTPVEADLSDSTNHVGILAALCAARPGRTRVTRSTPQIDAWFAAVPNEEGVVY